MALQRTCWSRATGWRAKAAMSDRDVCASKSTPPDAHTCMSIRLAGTTVVMLRPYLCAQITAPLDSQRRQRQSCAHNFRHCVTRCSERSSQNCLTLSCLRVWAATQYSHWPRLWPSFQDLPRHRCEWYQSRHAPTRHGWY